MDIFSSEFLKFNNFGFLGNYWQTGSCPVVSDWNLFAFTTPPMSSVNLFPCNSMGIFQLPTNTICNFNQGDIFNNISFGNMNQTPCVVSESNDFENNIEERTSITVEDVDYSIMGSEASKVKLLRPEMQRKVYEMFKYAQSKGWKMTISSGYRSTQKQTYLYNEWKAGRHKVPVVAKPGTSRHEFGCAVDIKVTGNGASIDEMGKFGRSIGLRWGGDWRKNRETWHFDIDPKKTASV